MACKVWKKNALVNNKYSKLVARVKRFITSVKNLSVNASCKDCLKGISNQVTEHPGEQASNESIGKVLKQGLETVKSCMFSFQFPLFLIGLWWSYFPEWCYDPECESKHTPCYIYLLEIPTPFKLIGFRLWFQSNEVSSITVLAFLSLEALDKKCRLLLVVWSRNGIPNHTWHFSKLQPGLGPRSHSVLCHRCSLLLQGKRLGINYSYWQRCVTFIQMRTKEKWYVLEVGAVKLICSMSLLYCSACSLSQL